MYTSFWLPVNIGKFLHSCPLPLYNQHVVANTKCFEQGPNKKSERKETKRELKKYRIVYYNFIFPVATLAAIIKALYAFTILPEVEISSKLAVLLVSPPRIIFAFIGKPDCIIIFFTCEALNLGYCERIKAATPATAGAAIEVPPMIIIFIIW